MRARTQRRKFIITVCLALRGDSLETRDGLDLNNYSEDDLYEMVMDLTGFDFLSDPEKKLAVVAFEEGADAAKKSFWYK